MHFLIELQSRLDVALLEGTLCSAGPFPPAPASEEPLPSQRLLKQFEERLVFGDMNLSENHPETTKEKGRRGEGAVMTGFHFRVTSRRRDRAPKQARCRPAALGHALQFPTAL